MSLTSELKSPGSATSRFFAEHLPNVREVGMDFRRRLAPYSEPVRPAAPGTIEWAALGTTIDHRLRVTLGAPCGIPVRFGVMSFAPGAELWDDEDTDTSTAILRAGSALVDELESYPTPPLLLDGPEGERLIRLCHTASYFEQACRSGRISGSLLRANVETTLQTLLDQVPTYVVNDIANQLQLASADEAMGWATAQDAVCGPIFPFPGGADADFICGAKLIDCKATIHPRRLGREEFYQLAGYLLLDYDDVHGIRDVALYLSRQGALVSWDVETFLGILGAWMPLAELRTLFGKTVIPEFYEPGKLRARHEAREALRAGKIPQQRAQGSDRPASTRL